MTRVNTTDKPSRTVIPMLLASPVSCAHPGCREFTFWQRASQRTEGTCLDHFMSPRSLIQEGIDLAEKVIRDVFGPLDFLPEGATPHTVVDTATEVTTRIPWRWAVAGTTRRIPAPLRPSDVGPCALCGRLHRHHYGPGGGPLCQLCEQTS
jgi:hypothetical protein